MAARAVGGLAQQALRVLAQQAAARREGGAGGGGKSLRIRLVGQLAQGPQHRLDSGQHMGFGSAQG